MASLPAKAFCKGKILSIQDGPSINSADGSTPSIGSSVLSPPSTMRRPKLCPTRGCVLRRSEPSTNRHDLGPTSSSPPPLWKPDLERSLKDQVDKTQKTNSSRSLFAIGPKFSPFERGAFEDRGSVFSTTLSETEIPSPQNTSLSSTSRSPFKKPISVYHGQESPSVPFQRLSINSPRMQVGTHDSVGLDRSFGFSSIVAEGTSAITSPLSCVGSESLSVFSRHQGIGRGHVQRGAVTCSGTSTEFDCSKRASPRLVPVTVLCNSKGSSRTSSVQQRVASPILHHPSARRPGALLTTIDNNATASEEKGSRDNSRPAEDQIDSPPEFVSDSLNFRPTSFASISTIDAEDASFHGSKEELVKSFESIWSSTRSSTGGSTLGSPAIPRIKLNPRSNTKRDVDGFPIFSSGFDEEFILSGGDMITSHHLNDANTDSLANDAPRYPLREPLNHASGLSFKGGRSSGPSYDECSINSWALSIESNKKQRFNQYHSNTAASSTCSNAYATSSTSFRDDEGSDSDSICKELQPMPRFFPALTPRSTGSGFSLGRRSQNDASSIPSYFTTDDDFILASPACISTKKEEPAAAAKVSSGPSEPSMTYVAFSSTSLRGMDFLPPSSTNLLGLAREESARVLQTSETLNDSKSHSLSADLFDMVDRDLVTPPPMSLSAFPPTVQPSCS